MHLSNEALRYERQLDPYRGLLTGTPANDDYFRAQAAQMHALLVIDAVNDLRIKAIEAGQAYSGDLHANLVYGVGRRTGDIWDAMRELVRIASLDRTQPLSADQALRASRALNTIYINIRGTLDNFAWALIEQAGGQKAVGLSHTAVDLFGPRFLGVKAFGDLADKLEPLKDWSSEVKERRNPAAHRIPLAVIPAQVTLEQKAEIERLEAQMFAPLRRDDFKPEDLASLPAHQAALRAKIDKIGSYRPVFIHLPREGQIEIYPTVAEDVGQMVCAARIVMAHLAQSATASPPETPTP